jgi:hypothetical protein
LLVMTAVALALCPASAAIAEAPALPAASGGENQLVSPIPGAPGERGLNIAGEAEPSDEAAEDEEGELEPEQPTPEQLALAQSAPLASAATIAPSDEGHAKYHLDAATYFDEYAYDGEWIRAHVDVIKAYPPFGDVYVKYGKPVIGYHDPATEGFAPLNQPEIEAYVKEVKRDMGLGYAGMFVDDANWSFTPSPGPESHLANLLEAIRKAEPRALIEMNSQYHDIWPKMKAGDPYVARALAQVNIVTKGVRRRTACVDHHGAGLHRTVDLDRHPAWKRDPRGDGR